MFSKMELQIEVQPAGKTNQRKAEPCLEVITEQPMNNDDSDRLAANSKPTQPYKCVQFNLAIAKTGISQGGIDHGMPIDPTGFFVISADYEPCCGSMQDGMREISVFRNYEQKVTD
jgi:hypothetical protein